MILYYITFIIGSVTLFFILLLIYIIAFTSLREYIPGYADVSLRRNISKVAIRSDSLLQASKERDVYIDNLEAIINDKGILVVPDILANSGGVIVSYFEWVQDKQNYFWTADEVRENLSSIMMKALKEVESMSTSKGVTWRDSALMIGVGRVAEAHHLRGLYP